MTDVIITRVCPFCGKDYQVVVFEEDYVRCLEGDLVQDCFPYLSATDREFLISGICPTCQDSIFKEV